AFVLVLMVPWDGAGCRHVPALRCGGARPRDCSGSVRGDEGRGGDPSSSAALLGRGCTVCRPAIFIVRLAMFDMASSNIPGWRAQRRRVSGAEQRRLGVEERSSPPERRAPAAGQPGGWGNGRPSATLLDRVGRRQERVWRIVVECHGGYHAGTI